MVEWTRKNRSTQLLLKGSWGRGVEEVTVGQLLQSGKHKGYTEEGSQDEQRPTRRAKDGQNT
jgi:hypothetical protein